MNWIPEIIIITTQKSIEDTFSGEYRTDEDLAQIRRRVTRVVKFDKFWDRIEPSAGSSRNLSPSDPQNRGSSLSEGSPTRADFEEGSPFRLSPPRTSDFNCRSMQDESE